MIRAWKDVCPQLGARALDRGVGPGDRGRRARRGRVMSAPAQVRREVTEEERAGLRRCARDYVRCKDECRQTEVGR